MTEKLNYRQAIAQALADAMRADPSVFILGEDVGASGGVFKTTAGLFDEFGPQRVVDTPIAEQAIVGSALGAALMGLRPVAEIMFSDFAGVCFDQIAGQLAKYRYMSGGQARVPVTIRMATGANGGYGAQHSQTAENWFVGIPGLKIVTPATPSDAYGLLRSAVADPDPVLFFEHKAMLGDRGTVQRQPIPLGQAEVVRSGDAVTVVANGLMRKVALEAAEVLAGEGIRVEVVDPRTLVPFDDDTVASSLDKTSRLLVVTESPADGSWAAALVARMTSQHFTKFDAPPVIVAAPDTPIPYARNLEVAWLPTAERVATQIRTLVAW